MANRIDLSNILINFLKKARYERHIEEGTLEENQFYAVTDGNEKTEYGDLFGNIENQADLYNALYASRLFKMEMCNDARGYELVHKLYDRREFDLSKFTVVGNPVISEDGIASGFNRNRYVEVPLNIVSNKFTVKGEFSFGEDLTTFQFACDVFSPDISRYIISLRPVSDNTLAVCYWNGAKTEVVFYSQTEVPRIANKSYNFEIEIDGSTAKSTINGISKTINNFVFVNVTKIVLGSNYNATGPCYCSLDLKQFSITVDGEEVFNGLKDLTQYDTYTLPSSEVITIPYIPSVDGVKIVDVAYKPLVDQLYTETGMGNYIIIDETNKTFRLPLPDIYSQIEKKTSFTLRKWED